MTTNLPGRWWIALITVERGDQENDIIPDWAIGACGWIFSLEADEAEAANFISEDVYFAGLSVIEIDELQEVFDISEIAQKDEHLAQNVETFESGCRTAWGGLHCYLAKGEA